MLKGRSNYLCLHRLHEGAPQDEEEGLFDQFEAAAPTSKLGQDLLRMRDWADETETGDRDDLTPGVSDRAWSQVSVSSRECLGATKCAYGQECFAEAARERAKLADVIVTNHALLAIDAIEGAPVLPSHEVLIVDEAHELVSRVTGVATGELTPGQVNRAVRAFRQARQREGGRSAPDRRRGLRAAHGAGAARPSGGDPRGPRLRADGAAGRLPDRDLGDRRHTRQVRPGRGRGTQAGPGLGGEHPRRGRADHATAPSTTSSGTSATTASARPCRVAPLSVSGLLREKLFEERSVVLTSATLKLGGDFNGVAASLGLAPEGQRGRGRPAVEGPRRRLAVRLPQAGHSLRRQAPGHARPRGHPQRHDGRARRADRGGRRPHARALLLDARRPGRRGGAARPASDHPILLQGEETLGELIKAFAADPKTCLFGTLSLWQGVDVPGASCQLVVMDRIPFPRPDDPLMSARQKSVEEHGGNGFMAVAATHAALLMAQGAGRLVRATGDRGVVAVLDPRLATARYGSFLRASMPDFWYTTDRNQVRRSLAAIDATATAEAEESA